MQAVTFEQAKANHRNDGGAIGRVIVRDYVGKGHQLTPGPQVYLGQQLDPGSELFAHFHDVDQFQVVVLGDGRFGSMAVAPITVQYADAYAPYGPIVAGEAGIGFFVFRRSAATGGWRMPEYANLIPGKIGRRFFVDIADLERIPPAGVAQHEVVWGPAEDGLEVDLIRLGPGAAVAPRVTACGAEHLLVCSGSLVREGADLPANAVLLRDDLDDAEPVTAGGDGAVVLVMKFPLATDRPGSDPGVRRAAGATYERAVNTA